MKKSDIAREMAEIGVLLKREGSGFTLSAAPPGVDLAEVTRTESGWAITVLVAVPGGDHFATTFSISLPAGRVSAETRSASVEALRFWCAFLRDVRAALNPPGTPLPEPDCIYCLERYADDTDGACSECRAKGAAERQLEAAEDSPQA